MGWVHDDHVVLSTCPGLQNKLQELWFGTLPMKIRQLPHGVLVVGLVLQILLLVTFVLLAGYEYQDNVGTQYMSVTQDNDKCIKYSRKWSGTYQLGTDGLWSSDTDFDATKVRSSSMGSGGESVCWQRGAPSAAG